MPVMGGGPVVCVSQLTPSSIYVELGVMVRNRRPSAQTRSVLEMLSNDPERWLHGYELSKETGIASGTLYPLLMRLADRGHLESNWEQPDAPGRPARHLYQLTATGRQYAVEAIRSTPRKVTPHPVTARG